MIRAGALFYAIVMALIIGLVSTSLILYAYWNKWEIRLAQLHERAQINTESGLNLLVAAPEAVPVGGVQLVDLYDEGMDSVLLQRKLWGAYEIGVATGISRKYRFTKAALIGSNLHSNSEVSLWLADQNKPLSLCGKTVIRGMCYLPKAGPKRAYIEGQSFVGSKLIDGTVRTSERVLPPMNREMIDRNMGYISNIFTDHDSLVPIEALGDSLSQSFQHKTVMLHSDGPVALTGQVMSGNVRVVSEQSVFIGAGSQLRDIVIHAPQVVIEAGFTGNIQVFASDSLVVGEGCRLQYPTVLGVARSPENQKANLVVKKGTTIDGVLFAWQERTGARNNLRMALDEETVIRGQVYCNGVIDMKATVYGSVSATRFLLATPSSVYENHLLNVTIDYSRLSKHFVGCNLVYDSPNRQVVKYLY